MNKKKRFINLLKGVIDVAKCEVHNIESGKPSEWEVGQITNIVIREMNELLQHALEGIIYYRFGKEQRMLESTYIMTDSMKNLWNTELGARIWAVQDLYNSL